MQNVTMLQKPCHTGIPVLQTPNALDLGRLIKPLCTEIPGVLLGTTIIYHEIIEKASKIEKNRRICLKRAKKSEEICVPHLFRI